MTTLYEKLGGAAAIDAAVELFYKKVLADKRINKFFSGVDMQQLSKHQKRFLTYAFGGEPSYSGQSLRAVHGRLVSEMGLNDSHFDAVVEDLASTLQELGISEALIDEVALVAESVRHDVLGVSA